MTAEPLDRLKRALAGRYDIRRVLGEGGMATVYLARDLKHERPVAIKVLKPELAVALGAERFLAEIHTTANLHHPHILPLHDSGEADGQLYFVTPFIEGETLADRLARDGALPLGDALDIAIAVGNALEHAHRQGVVHRDLKPSNILLQDGEALVADFGIALHLARDQSERLTGTGLSVGTPGYMSPEQLSGDEPVDPRTDLYALGALVFEMLTGEPPFDAPTTAAQLTRILTESPPSARARRAEVPVTLDRAIQRALARNPADRFGSAAGFVQKLRPIAAAHSAGPVGARIPRPLLAVLAAVVVLGGWWGLGMLRESQERTRVRTETIPEIRRLLEEAELSRAFRLAQEADEILPDDPTLADLLEAATVVISFVSDPSGARVSYRSHALSDSLWTEVGTTPTAEVEVPALDQLVARFELDGYRPLEVTAVTNITPVLRVRLEPEDLAEDMVWVAGGDYAYGVSPVAVDSFRLDRTEVTNSAFQSFVDQGGYDDPAWWPNFERAGEEVPFPQAMEAMTDRTGRAGPAGWSIEGFPEGTGNHPVGGVSWFEAVAYCRFRGARLPSFYHWKVAADLQLWDYILRDSNFGPGGSAAAGSSDAVNRWGAVDVAGNVREWVWNATTTRNYILGGSWESPTYMYGNYEAIDPWSRDETNGFRCASYPTEPIPEVLAEVREPLFDFRATEPADDETFAAFRRFYEFDPTPLDATAQVVDSTDDWTRERVEFETAYGERLHAHLFLPSNAQPPYQTALYFPGSAGFTLTSSEHTAEMEQLMFIPRSGRALLYPVLQGMYERQGPPASGPVARRQQIVEATQDIMRSVDYVLEREELDDTAIAYVGLSYGAELAVPVALEKRFQAAVLIGAALDPAWRGSVPEEAAPWNFVSRITTPSIVINGRQDVMHPYDEGQVPFFERIDVPADDKRFEVFPGGHLPDWNTVIRLTLDWLDERLGPVDGS